MGPNARLAQWESACLTRRWSQVQILHRALSGPERGGAGAGGRRHEPARGGAPPFRTARRFAPGIETPLRAGGALRRVPMHQCLLFVKGGARPGASPPFHTFPPTRAPNLRFAAICFLALGGTQAGLTHIADREEARERLGTPTSGRHRGPQGRERTSPTEKKRGRARERRPPVGTRAADGEGARPGTGTPVFRPAPRPAGPRTARC